MIFKVITSAQEDLREIFGYIAFALLLPENAEKQLERLEKQILCIEEQVVTILRVMYSGRNIEEGFLSLED